MRTYIQLNSDRSDYRHVLTDRSNDASQDSGTPTRNQYLRRSIVGRPSNSFHETLSKEIENVEPSRQFSSSNVEGYSSAPRSLWKPVTPTT